MKPFYFRFESLLKLRESAAKEALEKYAKALKERKQQEKPLAFMGQQYDALKASVANAREHAFNAAHQIAFLAALSHKEKLLEMQKDALAQAWKHERGCLSAYLKCKKACDILLKLREKHYNAYKESLRHWEEKQLEECAAVRASARVLAYE